MGGPARVRNYTVWQLDNAEPLWIRNPDGCVVDGLQVIAFNAWPGRQTVNISRGTVKNSVFRNFTIEAPFVPLLFLMPIGAESAGRFTRMSSSRTSRSPRRTSRKKSPFGRGWKTRRPHRESGLPQPGHQRRQKVTAQNCGDYFDLAKGVTVGQEIVFE